MNLKLQEEVKSFLSLVESSSFYNVENQDKNYVSNIFNKIDLSTIDVESFQNLLKFIEYICKRKDEINTDKIFIDGIREILNVPDDIDDETLESIMNDIRKKIRHNKQSNIPIPDKSTKKHDTSQHKTTNKIKSSVIKDAYDDKILTKIDFNKKEPITIVQTDNSVYSVKKVDKKNTIFRKYTHSDRMYLDKGSIVSDGTYDEEDYLIHGSLIFPTKIIFEGLFVDSVIMSGNVIMPNGITLKGSYNTEDKYLINGMVIFPNGFVKNYSLPTTKDEQCKMFFTNGSVLSGVYNGDNLIKGRKVFLDGEVQEGTFKNGFLIKGTIEFPCMTIHEGTFDKSYLTDGTITFPEYNNEIFKHTLKNKIIVNTTVKRV
jgi:hypothetical protein